MAAQPHNASRRTASRVGEHLLRALTQQEVAHLLNALVEVTSPANWEMVLDRLQPDTRQTLQRIVSPSDATGQVDATAPPQASLAKLQETWAGLWDDWQEIVFAATEEDGKYIEQEAHWEEPYFDQVTFMEDLEDVAAQLRPLLETAFENAFSPTSGFAEALDEAVAEVEAALPEWMALHDHFSAGEHLTTCVLTWEWLTTIEEEEDAFDFACAIREWENAVSHCHLQSHTVLHFFAQLSEAEQQRVFTGLTENRAAPLWKRELENVYSHWYTLYMDAIERYAPERYADNLRPTISQQWQNGLPVIEACLSREDYHESLAVIEETLASLLRSRSDTHSWTPESALLFPMVHGFRAGSENLEPHKSLLRSYLRTAQVLGHIQRANALELQLTAFDHFNDWQYMFEALDRTDVNEEIRQALFASWQHAVTRRAKPYVWRRDVGFGASNEPWWLHWLLDSIRDPYKGPDWFRNTLGAWLAALPEKRKTFDDDFAVLRLLTHDVMALHGDIPGRYPRFCDVVLKDDDLSTPDEVSRRTYLQQYAPEDVLEQVMTYWQENLQAWVPRPEMVEKSDYTQHARWMSALRELAPQAYEELLARWQEHHHRRRNLWKSMTQMGLD